MPPESNNKNIPPVNAVKIGLDPIFKNVTNDQKRTTENQSISASALNVLNNQKYAPDQKGIAIPIKAIINNNPEKKSIVRTYKSDLESAIQSNHLSSVNIAIAETEKKRELEKKGLVMEQPVAHTGSKNKIILLISFILIIIGVIGLATLTLLGRSSYEPITQLPELPSLFTAETKGELNISLLPKERIINAISANLNDTKIQNNLFYNLYLTTGTGTARRRISTSDFITLAELNVPDIVKRTLLPEFMIGTYVFGGNLPFIILKTSYFENAYAGLFQWETTLHSDLKQFFRLSGYNEKGGILADINSTVNRNFKDGVIINKDVRLLEDEAGEIILIYGIIDKETIIFTTNEASFKEIVNRLNKEKGMKR
jgi:hypothetical protein